MLTRDKADLCCLQKTRWTGGLAHPVQREDSICKFFWSGDQSGVGIMVAKKLVSNVISVTKYDHCCLQLHFLVGAVIVNLISCYAPQSGLSIEEKDAFYDKVISLVTVVPHQEMLLIGGDFIEHAGEHSAGFESVHEGNGYGVMNQDGLEIHSQHAYSC